MIPETENLQEEKGFCPGEPVRHSQAYPGRCFTQSPQCWFSREAAAIDICVMYRPDQPALSAQTDPADTFRLSGIYVQSSYS